MTGDDSLHFTIGEMKGVLAGVVEQNKVLMAAVEKSREESSIGRSRLYRELEVVRADIAESKGKIEKLAEDVTATEPVVTEIKRWKERFIGMQMLLGALSAAAGGAIVLGWKWIAVKIGLQ
ncbi:DUF1515 family protein [Agrobacterium vitis]